MQQFQNVYCFFFSIFFYFDLQLFIQSKRVKVTFFEILGAPRKNQCYSIFLGALCIQQFRRNVQCSDATTYPKCMCKKLEIFLFCNCKVQWFLIACFNLSLATHILDEKFILSGNFLLQLNIEKQQYCSFHVAPCTYYFQSRECVKSCLLIFI